MADVWLPESEIYLAAVPWDSSYNYVVNFTKNDLIDYIKGGGTGEPAGLSNTGTTYIRPGQPVTVDAPWSQVRKYNFCMVHNPAQPVEGSEEDYRFYFITDSAYASPASTVISLQVDVWSTYMVFRSSSTSFGQCFYESGHLAYSEIAYRQKQGYGNLRISRRYCSVDQPVSPANYYTRVVDALDVFSDGYFFMLTSSIYLKTDFGDVSNPKIEVPFLTVKKNNLYGTDVFFIDRIGDAQNLILYLNRFPWIAQGLVSLVALPKIILDDDKVIEVKVGSTDESKAVKIHVYDPGNMISLGKTKYINGTLQAFDDVYSDVPSFMLPVFLHSPYSVIELTNFTGSPVMLQPELCNLDSVGAAEAIPIDIRGSFFPGDEKVMITPKAYGLPVSGKEEADYNVTTILSKDGDDNVRVDNTVPNGAGFDVSLVFKNFPRTPMCTDNASMYAASHANQIQWSYENASWTKSAAKMSAANSLDLARAQMGTNSQNQAIQNQLTDKQQMYSAVGSAISTVGNLASLNIGGALSSAANGVLGYLNTEAAQNASNAQFANNQSLLGYTADQNYQLANSIANGNYQNTISGIAARNRDAELTPPSVSGQFGGTGSCYQLGINAAFCRVKTCSSTDIDVMSEFFMRYGIEVHEWVTFSPYMLCNMTRFSFHKIPDIAIKNSLANDTEVNALKGIFARGVTVVSRPEVIQDLGITRNDVRWVGPAYTKGGL